MTSVPTEHAEEYILEQDICECYDCGKLIELPNTTEDDPTFDGEPYIHHDAATEMNVKWVEFRCEGCHEAMYHEGGDQARGAQ